MLQSPPTSLLRRQPRCGPTWSTGSPIYSKCSYSSSSRLLFANWLRKWNWDVSCFYMSEILTFFFYSRHTFKLRQCALITAIYTPRFGEINQPSSISCRVIQRLECYFLFDPLEISVQQIGCAILAFQNTIFCFLFFHDMLHSSLHLPPTHEFTVVILIASVVSFIVPLSNPIDNNIYYDHMLHIYILYTL